MQQQQQQTACSEQESDQCYSHIHTHLILVSVHLTELTLHYLAKSTHFVCVTFTMFRLADGDHLVCDALLLQSNFNKCMTKIIMILITTCISQQVSEKLEQFSSFVQKLNGYFFKNSCSQSHWYQIPFHIYSNKKLFSKSSKPFQFFYIKKYLHPIK